MNTRTNGTPLPSEHEQLTALLKGIDTGIDALGNALSAIEMALRDITDRLATTASSTSSVELKTSARGVDVAVKVYAGSDVQPASDAAVVEYFRVLGQISALSAGHHQTQPTP